MVLGVLPKVMAARAATATGTSATARADGLAAWGSGNNATGVPMPTGRARRRVVALNKSIALADATTCGCCAGGWRLPNATAPSFARPSSIEVLHAGGIWGWLNRGPKRASEYSLGMRQALARKNGR